MTLAAKKELITSIVRHPEAQSLVDELNRILEEEKKKRLHFYEVVSEMEKSEFINGEIIIHSPVRKEHNVANGNLFKIIDGYAIVNDLGFVGFEKILIQLTRNDYEPDICFFSSEKADKFEEGQKFFPAPDLVVEVLSKSTAGRDRGIKYEDYQNHKVKEYWIVNAQKKQVEQYILEDNQYELRLKSDSGEIKCEVLKGLTIPIPIIFDKKQTHQFIKNL
ncbi:MAG: Uma2 family endonuclease [Bacteroidota bacterium]